MGYRCITYWPCGNFSSFARGDTRKHLEEEEEEEEKTTEHKENIFAGLHLGLAKEEDGEKGENYM